MIRVGMLYQRKARLRSGGHSLIHLEEEHTKMRVSGYGSGEFVCLKDEYGNTWAGTAYKGEDERTYYHLTDPSGKRMTGVSNEVAVTFRDDLGRNFKGLLG
jgi:hypothetical protein